MCANIMDYKACFAEFRPFGIIYESGRWALAALRNVMRALTYLPTSDIGNTSGHLRGYPSVIFESMESKALRTSRLSVRA